MNGSSHRNGFWGYVGAALVALGVVVVMVTATRRLVTPPDLNAGRIAERYQARDEVRAVAHQAMTAPAWINREKGIVRLPIPVALELSEKEWRDPVAARSRLIERVRKAHEAPPPPPAEPSPYE